MHRLGIAALVILGLAVLCALPFAGGALRLAYKETLGRAHMDADRRIFEESRSYVLGKTQELAKIKSEYEAASPGDRIALRAMIRHEFADVDKTALPNGLGLFLEDMRGY